MTEYEFETELEELSSAEDFLDYFRVPYDPRVVQVNRLHILQRFHDYLTQVPEVPYGAPARWAMYADRLSAAYGDFVGSDARTEKVFRVFRMQEAPVARVPLSDLTRQSSHAAGL